MFLVQPIFFTQNVWIKCNVFISLIHLECKEVINKRLLSEKEKIVYMWLDRMVLHVRKRDLQMFHSLFPSVAILHTFLFFSVWCMLWCDCHYVRDRGCCCYMRSDDVYALQILLTYADNTDRMRITKFKRSNLTANLFEWR